VSLPERVSIFVRRSRAGGFDSVRAKKVLICGGICGCRYACASRRHDRTFSCLPEEISIPSRADQYFRRTGLLTEVRGSMEFSEVRVWGVLRSTCLLGDLCAIRAMRRLAPPTRGLLHREARRFRYSPRPRPIAQAEGLYLPFPKLCLRDALRPVGGTGAPEQPNRPSYLISRDLLLRQVHADFFR
jgi:hypothetical protein